MCLENLIPELRGHLGGLHVASWTGRVRLVSCQWTGSKSLFHSFHKLLPHVFVFFPLCQLARTDWEFCVDRSWATRWPGSGSRSCMCLFEGKVSFCQEKLPQTFHSLCLSAVTERSPSLGFAALMLPPYWFLSARITESSDKERQSCK